MKRSRILIVGVAVGLATLLLAAVASLRSGPSDAADPRTPPSAYAQFQPTAEASKELKNLALQYHDRLGAAERSIASLEERLARIQLQSETTLKLLAELQRHVDELTAKREPRDPAAPTSDALPRIETFDLAPEKKPERVWHVPAGSFAEGTLLTGILAPVGGDALPVLIKLDALAIGPNRSRLPLKDAFLVGKATGDANSSRAIIQLHLLSYVGADGRTIERKVNGWIADADGMQGLKGEYVWNASRIATLSIAAGGLQGMANAFATSQTTVATSPAGNLREVTGNAKDFALFQGGGSALANVARIIEERMREFAPGVFVSNRDRKLTAIFLEGVTLDADVFEGNPDAASKRNPYSDLDASDRRTR